MHKFYREFKQQKLSNAVKNQVIYEKELKLLLGIYKSQRINVDVNKDKQISARQAKQYLDQAKNQSNGFRHKTMF